MEAVVVTEGEGLGDGGEEREKVMQLFTSVRVSFNEDGEKRESIKECVKLLEEDARELRISMETIHHCQADEVQSLCDRTKQKIENVRVKYSNLQKLIPRDQYYRYHDYWKFVTQRLSFVVTLLVYLESGRLASRSEVASTLGIDSNEKEGFHLDLEDYLHSLLTMASELSRLAVNSVTHGNYQRPFDISLFLGELSSGFRLLNLRNDGALRKRFDSLKYDVKTVEGVVYDITIRGLKPNT